MKNTSCVQFVAEHKDIDALDTELNIYIENKSFRLLHHQEMQADKFYKIYYGVIDTELITYLRLKYTSVSIAVTGISEEEKNRYRS